MIKHKVTTRDKASGDWKERTREFLTPEAAKSHLEREFYMISAEGRALFKREGDTRYFNSISWLENSFELKEPVGFSPEGKPTGGLYATGRIERITTDGKAI